MGKIAKRTLRQNIKWWWNTRVLGLVRMRLGGKLKRRHRTPGVQFSRDAEPMPEAKNNGITVILTAYRRATYLPDQIKSLRAQTVPPDEIWVWSNRSEDELVDVSDLADRVVISNSNYLFWGRFALASLARTKYIAFFDDDNLPQPQWFANCMATIEAGYNGILGGSGVILPATDGYSSKHKAGWNGIQCDQVTEVDLVGHSWFMDKAHLKYMWFEEPVHWDNGEDIHLSYMALKHGGVKTYVPPHPESSPEKWSCRPDFGKVVGRMGVATYKTKDHRNTRNEIVDAFRTDGWKVVVQRQESAQ